MRHRHKGKPALRPLTDPQVVGHHLIGDKHLTVDQLRWSRVAAEQVREQPCRLLPQMRADMPREMRKPLLIGLHHVKRRLHPTGGHLPRADREAQFVGIGRGRADR